MNRMWTLWAKALGNKASENAKEANIVAMIRTVIALVYLVTNIVIVCGIFKHWSD
jgi:hypothetical protein